MCGSCLPLIPTLKKQKQVDLSEFEARLLYIVSSKTDKDYIGRTCLKNKQAHTKKFTQKSFVSLLVVYSIKCHQKCSSSIPLGTPAPALRLGQPSTVTSPASSFFSWLLYLNCFTFISNQVLIFQSIFLFPNQCGFCFVWLVLVFNTGFDSSVRPGCPRTCYVD